MKAQAPRGSLEYEIEGEVQGQIPDPLIERFEYEDPAEPGRLRIHRVERSSAEFTLRVPQRAAGRSLKFFERRRLEPGRLGALAERELVGEVAIPAATGNFQALSAPARLSTLLTNGPTSARLNIVVLAEGFRTSEEAAFTNRAKAVVSQFLNTSPYKEYRNHFNAFALFVASAESGSDHPSRNIARNTYFNSTYDSYGLDRLITIPPNDRNSSYSAGQGRVVALLGQFVPDYDIALMLVNDGEYGGSGGAIAITSINSSSAQIAIHEIGHSFGALGDEYEDAFPGFPDTEEPNTTRQVNRDLIKWRDWILPSTPVPTPKTGAYASQVGLFEGAHFHSEDWYRPKQGCKMRTLESTFCEVCKEALVLSTYTKLSIIQGSSPVANNLTVPGGGEILLRVNVVEPAGNPLAYTWTIDGVTNFVSTSNSFPASFATLGVGTRLVRVQVQDETPLVRTDNLARLWKSRSWLVQVLSESNQPPTISFIPEQTILSGQSVVVPFFISDPDTPISSLTVSADATDMVVVERIVLDGTGTNRTVTITTSPERSGTTTVTIAVNDGTQSATAEFILRVEAPPRYIALAPIADQRAFSGPLSVPLQVEGNFDGPLTFSARSSNPALLPESNIHFYATNLVTLAPVPGATGSSAVTIDVSDGINLASRAFDVTFLARPVAAGAISELTVEGIRLRFTSGSAATMVLEISADMEFWSPISVQPDTTAFDFLIPTATIGAKAFYRVRLVPL